MPSAISRHVKNRRNTRRNIAVTRPQPTTPISMTDAEVAGSVATITFDQPVILKGVPKYTTDVGGSPAPAASSAALTSPTTLEVTFSASIAAATEIRIPYEEPSVRNSSGGFVSHTTFPVAA